MINFFTVPPGVVHTRFAWMKTHSQNAREGNRAVRYAPYPRSLRSLSTRVRRVSRGPEAAPKVKPAPGLPNRWPVEGQHPPVIPSKYGTSPRLADCQSGIESRSVGTHR